ncbi:hemerythrin domain-containing protein [Nocardia brevicatena]|uniref:hemerythrin domain-containing protein n=1 Tax=Nocardia brevicatena TaxID=37327 RepID=UPI0002E587FD|nr:hemerythrin domain-containing protein [Nocardia brevicatena]
MTDRSPDVIDILTHDHREVEQMFAELETLMGSDSAESRTRRRDLTEQVTIELIRHSVAEEAEVYPAVKKKVSETEAEQAKHEHAEAEETMKRLERLQPDDPRFEGELMTLMQEIRTHVAEEERVMFPHMRNIFTPAELAELGQRVERIKRIAPTRPHPAAPDTPPGDKILGPVTGLLDRMRDAVTHRGTDR